MWWCHPQGSSGDDEKVSEYACRTHEGFLSRTAPLASFWLELCLCAQSQIVSNPMAHKAQTLMSAPVFVYQMEISGHLFV